MIQNKINIAQYQVAVHFAFDTPTRVTITTGTIIDHIVINDVTSSIHLNHLTDHNSVACQLSQNSRKKKKKKIKVLLLRHYYY